jgi:hypothetical protein
MVQMKSMVHGIRRIYLPILLLVVTLVLPAHAVPLLPGGTALLSGVNLADRPELDGDFIASNTVLFRGTNALGQVLYTGTLVTAVILEQGTGTLDFYYGLSNDQGSTDGIERLSVTNFAGFATDVDWVRDLEGSGGPITANRQLSGGTISFSFGSLLLPGQTSDLFFIKTNATDFHRGSAVVSNGGVASIQAFAPSGTPGVPIPESGSLLLLGTGLVGCGLWRRIRRQSYRFDSV